MLFAESGCLTMGVLDEKKAEELYNRRKNDTQIARLLGVSQYTVSAWRNRTGRPTNLSGTVAFLYQCRKEEYGNPCMVCQRNIAECPWLHEDRPVKGWDAKLVSKKGYYGSHVYFYTTWEIKECPLYIEPKKERQKDV